MGVGGRPSAAYVSGSPAVRGDPAEVVEREDRRITGREAVPSRHVRRRREEASTDIASDEALECLLWGTEPRAGTPLSPSRRIGQMNGRWTERLERTRNREETRPRASPTRIGELDEWPVVDDRGGGEDWRCEPRLRPTPCWVCERCRNRRSDEDVDDDRRPVEEVDEEAVATPLVGKGDVDDRGCGRSYNNRWRREAISGLRSNVLALRKESVDARVNLGGVDDPW